MRAGFSLARCVGDGDHGSRGRPGDSARITERSRRPRHYLGRRKRDVPGRVGAMRNEPRDPAPGAHGGILARGDVARLTDGQLLGQFVTRRDETAFEMLLRRHGSMVLGVCRRVLHDRHDADDAFQATFLVLVRNAAAIAKRESVASWLYGVAYRIAVKARARAHRRSAQERHIPDIPRPDPVDDVLWRDLRPVLDEEVGRLPEKYRAPVVLCYLEGVAYAEAARRLGCSKGTVALRLAEARERLRERLSRRGIVLSLGLFTAAQVRDGLQESVPDALARATTEAALRWALDGEAAAGAVSASVAALVRAGVSALAWAKLKLAAAVVLAVVVAGGAGLLTFGGLAEKLAAWGSDTPAVKKGKKTLADRLDGLPPQK